MKQNVEQGGGAGAGPVATTDGKTVIGHPEDGERRALSRGGVVLAVADLMWIPQAGLIAFALGLMLTSLHAPQDGGALETLRSLPVLASVLGFGLLAIVRAGLQKAGLDMARTAARSLQSRARASMLSAAAGCSPAAPFPASGAFAAHVTEQVGHLGPYYRNFVPQTMRLKIVPLAIVFATAWNSWLAALILVICGPLIPVFMALIGMKAKTASADQQEELTRLSGVLLDRIRGLETLQLFGALDRTREDIAVAGERFRTGTMRVLKIAFLSSTVLELFSALGIAFCAVYVGFSLLGEITLGTWGPPLGYAPGLFILLLAPEFFSPLRAYAAAYHDRAAGLAAQGKLTKILSQSRAGAAPERLTVPVSTEASPVPTAPPAISLRSVTLVLAGRSVFKDLDLEIEPGETVFLTGASGSGKTCLLDMILGFHVPSRGAVRIDGLAPQQYGREFLQTISWLGQAPRLFHGSLRANLLKGACNPETVSDADIRQALDLAGAAGLVGRLPQGLSTRLGEDGFGLSVGEMRRVALARAALRTGSRLFVADEPTAGLDEDTAGQVIEGMKRLAGERTSVIATHDPAVLQLPGRVIDLGLAGCETGREGAA